MDFLKQRFPEHSHILCPCTRCLNQSELAQAVVHDHLLLFGMSAAYTRWTQHGECANAGNIEFSEQVRAHEYDSGFGFQEDESNHHDGIAMDEEANNGNEDMSDVEMIAELYRATEEDGQVPNFTRVLRDLKRTLCLGSSHSRFSYVVRLLRINSRYEISNTAFNALLKLMSPAFPQAELPSTYKEANKYLHELCLA